ncbi:AVPR1B [Branchiostoma lanceolatum]|uniref:AVPR1B protein n=1 Tax=Branchiostoma lanceolatum TaxID=7740 RepID=A0A8K0EIH1_BRALA|nr:AVPR1B [Branchiostoma lanceolatum]
MAAGDPFAAPVRQWSDFVPPNSTDSPPTPFLLNASHGLTTAGPNATAWEDDIAYNRHSRVIALGVLFTAGLCGNLCVCNWMRVHRKKKSRHNTFVLNLTVADLLVTLITVLSQIIWELMEDAWMALDVGCRVVKFGQVFAIIASSNMIVLLALDRHNVIIKPFSSRWRPWKITAAGWAVSVLLAAPQAYVFREVLDEDGVPYCRSIFSSQPAWHLQIYIIYGATVVFVVPFCILSYTYSRVLAKVWIRARAGSPRELERKAGGSRKTQRRVSCVAQAGNLLPRAKLEGQVSNGSCLQLADESSARRAGVIKADLECKSHPAARCKHPNQNQHVSLELVLLEKADAQSVWVSDSQPVKTLKMTLVIIMAFVLCGLPYFIVEIKVAFGGMSQLDMDVYAVLGVFAVANSAVNPFVFLFFNSNNKFLHSLEQKCCFSCLSKKRVREGVKRMEVVIASWSPSRRASRPSVSLRAYRAGGGTLSANL